MEEVQKSYPVGPTPRSVLTIRRSLEATQARTGTRGETYYDSPYDVTAVYISTSVR